VVIGTFYHPPKSLYKDAKLIDELERVTETILAEHDDILVILAGDFNQLSDSVLVRLGYASVFTALETWVTFLIGYMLVTYYRINNEPLSLLFRPTTKL